VLSSVRMTSLGEGCYLVYESDSSGRLMAVFCKADTPSPENAVGFWSPGEGKKIQGFKFKQNSGRSELVRGCSGGVEGRKKYYTGYIQFLKSAKNYNGKISILTKGEEVQGLDVQVFGFTQNDDVAILEENKAYNISDFKALACIPMGINIYEGIQNTNETYFLTQGGKSGYSSGV